MKTGIIFFIFCVVYLGFGVFISNISFEKGDIKKDHLFYDYSGVLNVHSNSGSGSGSYQEIISAGNDTDLDFIFFNSENPINKKQPSPISFGNLNVFYDLELKYKNSNFLKLSAYEAEVFESKSGIEISMSNSLDSFNNDLIILAHPEKQGHQWERGLPDGLNGIEVINLREIWNLSWENNKLSFFTSLIFYPFNPKLFFLKIFSKNATSEDLLDKWNNERVVMGFLGSDATSKLRVLSKTFIQFPSYSTLFSLAKNHILLEEELTGRGNHEKIIEALKNGQSYFSLDVLGDPEGFAIFTKSGRSNKVVSKTTPVNQEIFINIPKNKHKMRAKILFNGKLHSTLTQSGSFAPKEAGVYRVRVEIKPLFPILRNTKWLPWIYSNSFQAL